MIRVTVVVWIALLTSACGQIPGRAERNPDQDFKNFVALAEDADEQGFTPYWLGRSFKSGELVFEGPSVADFGAEVVSGGIDMSYAARVPGSGTVALNLTLYSSQAWDIVENQICEAGHCITRPGDPTERRTVQAAGQEALLLVISGGTRPVNGVRLIVHMGETVVRAEALSGGAPTPGAPDLNPLIEPDELLRVMEQLRPYPQ